MSLHLLLVSSPTLEIVAAAEEPGSGRLGSALAVLLGVASVAAAGLALARARRPDAHQGRNAAIASVVLGLAGAAAGVALLADSAGDVGTGAGRGGSIVALVIGVVGAGLGGWATARALRAAQGVA